MSATIAELLRAPGLDPLDARVLLRVAIGASDAQLVAHPERVPGERERERFKEFVERRRSGEPVAYITGEREFYSLAFRVTPDVLIPRPETELLVEAALEHVPPDAGCRVLDLGTGSGCVAVAIARERPRARLTATDIAPAALAVARANAATHGADIELIESDWLGALAGRRFDVIVSNPPYVAEADPHLAQGDASFEPHGALASGPAGLDAIEAIVEQARAHLVPGGVLLFEHGHEQGSCSRVLLAAHGYERIFTRCDLSDRERVSGGGFDGTRSQPLK
jgi:release factor glutamine methyltransferase